MSNTIINGGKKSGPHSFFSTSYLVDCAKKNPALKNDPEAFVKEAADLCMERSGINDKAQRERDLKYLAGYGCRLIPPEEQEKRKELQRKALEAYLEGERQGEYYAESIEGIDDIPENRKLVSILSKEMHENGAVERWKDAAQKNDGRAKNKLFLEAIEQLVKYKDDPVFREDMTDEELLKAYPRLNALGRSCADVVSLMNDSVLIKNALLKAEDNKKYKAIVDRLYAQHTAGVNRIQQLANPLYPYVDDKPIYNLPETELAEFKTNEPKTSYMQGMYKNIDARYLSFGDDVNKALEKNGMRPVQCEYYDLEGNPINGVLVGDMQKRGKPMYVADPTQLNKEPVLLHSEPGVGIKLGKDAQKQLETQQYLNGEQPGRVARFLYKNLPGLAKLFYSRKTLNDLRCWTNKEELAKSGGADIRDDVKKKIKADAEKKKAKAIESYNERANKWKNAEEKAREKYPDAEIWKQHPSVVEEKMNEVRQKRDTINKTIIRMKTQKERQEENKSLQMGNNFVNMTQGIGSGPNT